MQRRIGLVASVLVVALVCIIPSVALGSTPGSVAAVAPGLSFAATVVPDPTGTPEPTVTPPPATDATITLLAVGDLMCHRDQLAKARTHGGYDFFPGLRAFAPLASGADIAVGNLETTLRTSGFTGYPAFRSPRQYADALKRAGFDVLTTANNHSLDGGRTGVRYTASYLDRIGIAHTGTDNDGPAIVERDGVKVAFLAYTYATNGIRSPYAGAVNRLNMTSMRRAIVHARTHADIVVVCPHWGTEYSSVPEARTRVMARALIDAGADLVLGSHPHVVRPIEKYRGHYIVYSMGNFISAMAKPRTDLGIAVRVVITKRAGVAGVASLKVIPVWRDRSSGAGTSTYRTVSIQRALAVRDRLTSASDRARMRNHLAYCRRMYRTLLQ
ncbi:MAG: CapA family protein [Coriobacteriia bacterium]|nr:CapA family protein [Coriobacteriia bacterium]